MTQVRERIEKYGVKSLFDFEAISLLTGIDHKEIATYATLYELKDKKELIKGTDLQKQKLDAVFELCERFNTGEALLSKITCPEDVYKIFRSEMGHLKKEEFRILLLNTKNYVIGKRLISVGSLNASIVHPREVFKEAILSSAKSIVLTHNHPSFDTSPSKEDCELSKRLVEAGELLGIKVLDHIIIGANGYTSLKEEDLM